MCSIPSAGHSKVADDFWQTPHMRKWVDHILTEMKPKLESSTCSLVLTDGREGDVKLWVEIGASIMLDKPILAVVFGSDPVPRKLRLVADEVVRLEDGINPEASEKMKRAITRVMRKAK